MLNFETLFEQLKPGQNRKIPFFPHPFLIAYLLHNLNHTGPHILVSSQKDLLVKIKKILLLLEPEQKVFSLIDIPFPWQETFDISHSTESQYLKLIALAHTTSSSDIFMVHPQTFKQRVVPPDLFRKKVFHLKQGQRLPWPFSPILINLGYQSRDYVEQIGEFSIRGAVLDICCPIASDRSALSGDLLSNSSCPLRIELMGDEIIQIKMFDVNTQKNLREITEAVLPPIREWSVYDKKDTYQKIKNIINSRNKERNSFPSFREWNLILNSQSLNIMNFEKTLLFEKTTDPSSKLSNRIRTFDFLSSWRAAFIHQSPFTILDHFNSPLIWNLDEPDDLKETLHLWKEEIQNFSTENSCYPSFSDMCLSDRNTEKSREITFDPLSDPELTYSIPPSSFSKNFFKNPIWTEQIKKQREKGMLVFICAGKEKTRKELKSRLAPAGIKAKEEEAWFNMKEAQQRDSLIVHLIQSFSCENLTWPQKNIIFLKADSFSFDVIQKKKVFSKEYKQALSFSELTPGDLVVHKQHGIGLFKKLELLDFGTGENEFLILKYKEGDLLYVPVYALHQVQKYSSPSSPATNEHLLDKLGDTRWLNTKEKAKNRMRDMTMELVNLYNMRSSLKRKMLSSTSENFEKFEAEFPFTETPDQKKAIEDIIKDLTQKEQPMDRLICGDTGFGKTEVALRAAFKVIEEGFQICLIAPTTILSFQHFERFKERLNNWPIIIRLLNRFTSPQEKKQILRETKEGKVDILIGTHRILSRDIHLKKPGLLIIDEEHLFGVKSKEKIKSWYSHVDTISLSATPIPRSLSMSLSGIRDMSVILTPPLNRKGVHTFISPFREELIKKAISKEMNRKGQVIFIHNRISDIHTVEEKLKKLLPSVRIRMAHGKMKDLQQKIVLDFFHQQFDLLLCTTIIESGMDFPKANTLFINQAEQFGLSQLHQLRGRVGRSERSSYCYLLVDQRKKIPQPAMERLKIIQENNQPGAGITIAQYDLEMRGAGELMGAEQSGFLQNIGYEMYFEFLRETISSLKGEQTVLAPEPDLKFKQPAFIPRNYIPHEKTRLIYYKKLATASSEEEIEQIKTELKDFAGALPEEAENLILFSHIRWLAKKAHIRELSHNPPWLYMSLAESTPLPTSQILQWIEKGLCEWQNKSALKFTLNSKILTSLNSKNSQEHPNPLNIREDNLLHVHELLKNLF